MPHTKHPGKNRKNSLFLPLCASGIAGSLVLGLVRRDRSLLPAFGDFCMAIAVAYFAVAWAIYLAGEGVRFFSGRKSGKTSGAPTWKERVPALGEAPEAAPPVPGGSGPESPEYRKLLEAEENLRRKIAGEDSGEGNRARPGGKNAAKSLLAAGIVLFLTGLVFQYLVPLIIR